MSPLFLDEILQWGNCLFRLKQLQPTVTERTLSLQLKTLVEDGIIKRTVHTSKPPLKVEYSLTDFGKTLIPIIKSIADWGVFAVENHLK